MTGEPVPRDVREGDGNQWLYKSTGSIRDKTTTDFSQSTVAKVLELTENAQSRKAKAENFITRFAKVYTPVVVISALLLQLCYLL